MRLDISNSTNPNEEKTHKLCKISRDSQGISLCLLRNVPGRKIAAQVLMSNPIFKEFIIKIDQNGHCNNFTARGCTMIMKSRRGGK